MASSIRLSDQPSRPSASTCCFFSSLKTLLIPAMDHVPTAFVNVPVRYLWWPVFRCPSVAGFGRPPRLDDITLYWLTDTAASSARPYYESLARDFGRMPLELPVAVNISKGDFVTPLKVWADQTYSKLFYWNEVSKGGHFAALE